MLYYKNIKICFNYKELIYYYIFYLFFKKTLKYVSNNQRMELFF